MTKVLNLHSTGQGTISGWQTSAKYGNSVINQISDPNAQSAKKQITSIPSPFARIDLVKTAFKCVSEKDNSGNYTYINGNSIFNQMVSHSLDVGQIFFEYDKWSQFIEIIPWDSNTDLNNLLNDGNAAHRQLGDTIQLFLQQDGRAYNFDKMQRLYLLNYKPGPEMMNIIGCTSPATLFFCSANELSFVDKIFFGKDKPFDSSYLPLYQRDIEYHKYLQLLRITIPNFAALFPEVDAYLTACYALSDTERKQALAGVVSNDVSSYQELSVVNAGNCVEILGNPLHKKVQDKGDIATRSDFVIASTISTEKPLVLPVDMFTAPLQYTQSTWDSSTKVPFGGSKPWNQRVLPNDGTVYPYLTVNDFLEDALIRLDEDTLSNTDFNSTVFFDGNISSTDKKICFLLPIKPLFFDFFSTEELRISALSGGNKMMEIKCLPGGGVKVTLRIPIKKGFVEYHKNYYENPVNLGNTDSNDGCLIQSHFALSLFSNVRYDSDEMSHYRIGLVTSSDLSINMQCYKGNQSIRSFVNIRNNKMDNALGRSVFIYSIDGFSFDSIQIKYGDYKGFVIPIFKKTSGSDVYTFAIDFGTTNTHIEYSVNDSPAKPFDITKEEKQNLLFGEYDRPNRIFDEDFVPQIVGEDSDYRFPMRTILSVGNNTDWNKEVLPMVHASIPFTYGKMLNLPYNRVVSNLKWSNELQNVERIRCYIENLFMLLRNKVVLNNGSVPNTKIIWFYPISMTLNRYSQFKNIWDAAYQKYFGPNVQNSIVMTESVAPYEYFKGRYGAARIVNVDVGGGTSDVVYADSGSVKFITSFRFAANSIFGDGYANPGSSQINGIIQQFLPIIDDVLSKNDKAAMKNVLKTLIERRDSSELASFFFSLKGNSGFQGIADKVDFHHILQFDETQKIIFLIFYCAIIYHIGNLLKAKGVERPRYLTFSGNGSRVISIITPSKDLLERFTMKLFEKIFDGKEYDRDGLSIEFDRPNPKEVTCKGGILNPTPQSYMDLESSKVVLKGTDGFTIVGAETYDSISDKEINATAAEVRRFFKFFFEMNRVFPFCNSFGIQNEIIQIAEDMCDKDLETFTKNGLSIKRNEVDGSSVIEETLFFYPLNAVLNALAGKIYELHK